MASLSVDVRVLWLWGSRGASLGLCSGLMRKCLMMVGMLAEYILSARNLSYMGRDLILHGLSVTND